MDLRNFSDYFFEHLASGNSPGVLPITSACNAQCLFCSNNTNPFEIKRVRHRPLAEIEKIIWSMSPSFQGKFILNEAITGKLSEGEVFTHPQVFEILQCIRDKYKNNPIAISSNGSLMTEERIKRLAEFRPVHVPFSIHSFNRGFWKQIFKLKDKHYDTAINAITHGREYGLQTSLRMIAMPALVGYDDLENTVIESKERGYTFLGVTYASWTRYTKPEIIKQLEVDHDELKAFCDRMTEKYKVKVHYSRSAIKFDSDKFTRITKNIRSKRIYWFVSSAAYDKIKPVLEEIGKNNNVKNIVVNVKNHTYGGNITCAGLWTIKDIDRAIKENNLENENIVIRGRFLNNYGYDLMGDNIVDYMKETTNKITVVRG